MVLHSLDSLFTPPIWINVSLSISSTRVPRLFLNVSFLSRLDCNTLPPCEHCIWEGKKRRKNGMFHIVFFFFSSNGIQQEKEIVIISLFYRIVLSMINEFIKQREYIWQINFNLAVLVLLVWNDRDFSLSFACSLHKFLCGESRYTTKHDK